MKQIVKQIYRNTLHHKQLSRNTIYYYEYASIQELVQYINSRPILSDWYEFYKTNIHDVPASIQVNEIRAKHTLTTSYKEAESLLLHGWDYMSEEVEKRLKLQNTSLQSYSKSVYDVVGYQASVPRYLQGIPTNMIRTKKTPKRVSVITINKTICYNCKVKTDTIIQESVKVLRLIQNLEKQNIKVNLNVVELAQGARNSENITIDKIRIKNSGQRLNTKQTVFPLIHPSMLRRIILALIERKNECNNSAWYNGYGVPITEVKGFEDFFKGEYFIPSTVKENEITDIEKYLVK